MADMLLWGLQKMHLFGILSRSISSKSIAKSNNCFYCNFRLNQKHLQLCDEKEEITAIRPSPDRIHLAIGSANGNVEIFNIAMQPPELVSSYAVHRTAVNILRYDESGMKLASGGQDTDLVVLDVVAQTGICRLSGHTGPVTDTLFYESVENILISSSKDTHIKFWNLDTQSCFKTICDHSSEVWAISILRAGDFLIAGCGDQTMNVYKLAPNSEITEPSDDDAVESANLVKCNFAGSITRSGKGRTVNLTTDSTGKVMACHGLDNNIELFYFCNQEEAMQRLAKRLRKLSVEEKAHQTVALNDEIRRLPSIPVKEKIKSIDLIIGAENELRLIATFATNSMQLFSLNISRKHAEPVALKILSSLGHRTAARCLAFGSDGKTIASGSNDSLKIWNRESMNCIKTIDDAGHVICGCFAPGDRYVLLGLKTGELLIVDTVVGEILERIKAHTKELWSICLLPDLRGCVTGGGDSSIKIWQFELISMDPESESSPKQISLLHKQTHQLEETILCLKISRNSKFIAVGLLDSTVKIFFADSFKFYLSLYGHKLPVLCLDISDDSTIIATGSADRNAKIWGMDFGDCHRSLFAHDDSVMALQFIPKTHMFWTCGKDGKLKQWDADSFEKILTISGHIGEAYHLSIDPRGEYFVSCGSDKVIRLYGRTDETIVLQDVQEEEREERENKLLSTEESTVVPLLPNLNLPSKKTVGSEQGAESIMECLDVVRLYEESEDKTISPLMMAHNVKNPIDYIISVVARIRSSDLEESLILLPFSSVCDILGRIHEMLNKRKDQTELIVKIALLLFRIHHKTIVGNQTFLPILQKMLRRLDQAVTEMRDMIGMNKYGLLMLQQEVEAKDGIELFRDATQMKKQKDKKWKKRELKKRLHIQMA